MKFQIISLCILAATTLMAHTVLSEQPQLRRAWYEGETVHFIIPNENLTGPDQPKVPPVEGEVGNLLEPAVPLYFVLTEEDHKFLQTPVIDAIPGDPDYNPWWRVHVVFVDEELASLPFMPIETALI